MADVIDNLVFAVQLFFQFTNCIQHISVERCLFIVALEAAVREFYFVVDEQSFISFLKFCELGIQFSIVTKFIRKTCINHAAFFIVQPNRIAAVFK